MTNHEMTQSDSEICEVKSGLVCQCYLLFLQSMVGNMHYEYSVILPATKLLTYLRLDNVNIGVITECTRIPGCCLFSVT